MSVAYPPEPWDLQGQMHLSLFVVPRASLPPVPSGVRPVVLGRWALVVAAFLEYEPGSVVEYGELLTAVAAWRGRRLAATLPLIWVDSEASRDGGREMWGIPKELATFKLSRTGGEFTAEAHDDDGRIASMSFVPRLRLPGRWPAALVALQEMAGRLKVTPIRSTSPVSLGRGRWDFAAAGPLGYLAGRRPLISAALPDFRVRFGH